MAETESKPDTMQLWNSVRTTDVKFTKSASNGRFSFTNIDPTYQLRRATELWGPYGDKWGLFDLKWTTLQAEHPILMLEGTFVCTTVDNDVSFPIAVDMKLKAGDDCCKKLVTSAISKSLSRLGFSADVYLGMFDDVAYVEDLKTRQGDQQAFKLKALASIKKAVTAEDLLKCESRVNQLIACDTVDESIWRELLSEIGKRREAILTRAPA